jgi:two-component system phosphate regulon response regulator PhoB
MTAKALSTNNLASARRILVVEDQADLAEMIAYNLKRAGYDPTTTYDGRTALRLLTESRPDLVLLDLMIPELSGSELAGRIRTNPATADLPIIMVTAKTDEIDQLAGLAVGADDYITKPFSVSVLLARIEAVLRRAASRKPPGESLTLGGIHLDLASHEATSDGEAVKLTLTEFRLLAALIGARGRVLSRHHLMGKAMGPGVTVTERTIDVHITAIRKKLGDQGSLIRTVRGVGYRACEEPEHAR